MPEVHEVEKLRRAARMWGSLAIVSWVVFALVVLGAAAVIVVQRDQAIQAAKAEAEARAAVERASEQAAQERAAGEERIARLREENQRLLYAQQITLAQRQMERGSQKTALEWLEDALKK